MRAALIAFGLALALRQGIIHTCGIDLPRYIIFYPTVTLTLILADLGPGLLATVSATIGELGANILEVAHNRLALDVPAKGAEFDIMIETRDAQHTAEIMEALRERGYPPRAV